VGSIMVNWLYNWISYRANILILKSRLLVFIRNEARINDIVSPWIKSIELEIIAKVWQYPPMGKFVS
jgi:hypothetical protein